MSRSASAPNAHGQSPRYRCSELSLTLKQGRSAPVPHLHRRYRGRENVGAVTDVPSPAPPSRTPCAARGYDEQPGSIVPSNPTLRNPTLEAHPHRPHISLLCNHTYVSQTINLLSVHQIYDFTCSLITSRLGRPILPSSPPCAPHSPGRPYRNPAFPILSRQRTMRDRCPNTATACVTCFRSHPHRQNTASTSALPANSIPIPSRTRATSALAPRRSRFCPTRVLLPHPRGQQCTRAKIPSAESCLKPQPTI